MCRSANVAVPQDASEVCSLDLGNVNRISEGNSVVAVKAAALVRLPVVEKTAAASLSICTLDNVGTV